MKTGGICLAFGLLLGSYGVRAAEPLLETIEQRGTERIAEGRAVQRQVDKISEGNRRLLDDYQAQLKLVQGLETYVELLDIQLDGQREEIEALRNSVTDVAVIERQMLPLMARMIDALESFIDLDIPFLEEERRNRVAKLRALIRRSDVTTAEKLRRVFEAYQIENDYGRSIESYTAKLALRGGTYDAEYLRVGRIGLMFRTVGADLHGYWNRHAGQWQLLEESQWARMIEQGLRVARQEVAPQLVHIVVDPAQEAP